MTVARTGEHSSLMPKPGSFAEAGRLLLAVEVLSPIISDALEWAPAPTVVPISIDLPQVFAEALDS